MLLDLSLLVIAAFFFFCIGKTIDCAEGSKRGYSRFRGALVEGKYDAKTLASASVGFLTLDIMVSAFKPADFSYKKADCLYSMVAYLALYAYTLGEAVANGLGITVSLSPLHTESMFWTSTKEFHLPTNRCRMRSLRLEG